MRRLPLVCRSPRTPTPPKASVPASPPVVTAWRFFLLKSKKVVSFFEWALESRFVPQLFKGACVVLFTQEHCSWIGEGGHWGHWDEQCAAEISARGIFVCPTVPCSWGQQRFQGLRDAMGPAYRAM